MVTGSSGFVGTWLVMRLRSEGYQVFEFDRDIHLGDESTESHGWCRGDITDEATLSTILDRWKPDFISHLAAQAYVAPGEADPMMNARVNYLGTLNVLNQAAKRKIPTIFHSSGAVIGNVNVNPTPEDCEVAPNSHYGVSKLHAEGYALWFHQNRGLPVWITRFSSVYGISRLQGPINQMVRSALFKGKVTVFGDDQITRDYTHVRDVVEGVSRIIRGSVPSGRIYNIASGQETSLADIVQQIELIAEEAGRPISVERQEGKPGDVLKNHFDIRRMKKYGYQPRVGLYEGIREVWEYYKHKSAEEPKGWENSIDTRAFAERYYAANPR